MKILYGTTNKAKIHVMKNAVESLDMPVKNVLELI